MSINSALASADQQLITALTVHSIEPDEEPYTLTWPAFLRLLAEYAAYRGWDLVYDSPDDYSVAIFAHEETVPAAFDDERRDIAEKTISEWQLALF